MAIVHLDPHLLALHGRIGDVVYKTYGRKIVATRVPRFDGYIPSPAQRARRARMAEATAYAKRIYSDPVAKAVYVAAAQKLGRNAFRLAICDYLALAKGAAPRQSPVMLGSFGCRAESPNPAGWAPRLPWRRGSATPPYNVAVLALRSELGTRRPRRVRPAPRSLRAPRCFSPSCPLRPWRETVRPSIIEPPRRPRRVGRESRHDSAFPFFRASAMGLKRKEIAGITADRESAEGRKLGNKEPPLTATAFLDFKQRASPLSVALVTFCKLEQTDRVLPQRELRVCIARVNPAPLRQSSKAE